jgi:hypothetical protein
MFFQGDYKVLIIDSGRTTTVPDEMDLSVGQQLGCEV